MKLTTVARFEQPLASTDPAKRRAITDWSQTLDPPITGTWMGNEVRFGRLLTPDECESFTELAAQLKGAK